MPFMPNSNEIYTAKEAAEILGVKGRTIRLWLLSGYFPNAYRLDPTKRSVYRIPKEDIQAFIEKRAQKVSRPSATSDG
jgi:excisionase family DNA binding protein